MTAEYLDKSGLVARIEYYEKHTPKESGEHYAYSVALREIRNFPAADVASVTRCKNCARYRLNSSGGLDNWCNRTGFVQRDNDFCSYGKSREEL